MYSLNTFLLLFTAFAGSIATSLEDNLAASYAPVYVECPTGIQFVRPANGLNPSEAEWVKKRKKVVFSALEDYLHRLDLKDFNVHEYAHRMGKSDHVNVPILSMAISGGGYRSGITGTGAIRSLDSRLPAAIEQRTGGILQSLTYMTGQSGGSWPVISLPTHNFPTVDELVPLWHADNASQSNVTTTFKDLGAKALAGFPITIPDYLGRGVFGYEFLPGPNGGLNVTMSSIANQSKFLSHEMPMSMLQATQLSDNDVVYPQYLGLKVPYDNDTFYEFTPFEMGSWDKRVNAFTPMEYTGTRLENGVPVNSSRCVRGFDRASFLLGTAAAAWNFWYIGDYSNQTLAQWPKRALSSVTSKARKMVARQDPSEAIFPESTIQELITAFKEVFNLTMPNDAYATWPNPFAGTSASINESEYLQFVDATEAGTSLPLWPLIQPARNASFIIAWDDNAEALPYSWLNGTNFYNAYLEAKAAGLPFPIVPDPTTIVNRNYTINPTFYGCDPKLTTTNSTDSPIILYMTNAPYSAYTNYSWTQDTFTLGQLNTIFTNEFNQFTQGNGTLDHEWSKCLGCAVIDRSLEKIGMQRTAQCESCLKKYCWDGTYDDSAPEIVNPSLRLNPSLGFLEWNKTNSV